jgi:23S rRNA (cytosine1962-C5)-methyltransferase
LAQVVVKPRKARPFFGRHPWVLDTAIERIEGSPADGDVVDLVSDKGEFIARGVFNSRSRIHVRLYTWDPGEPLDESFWHRGLEAALRLRTLLGYDAPDGAARLVFSEGDDLSGLIVDRYADYLVIQPTALALAIRLPLIVQTLVELVRPQGILLRTERDIVRAEGIELTNGLQWGRLPEGPVLVRDHGLSYAVDLTQGQKTGFYLDQRENRPAAARYLRDRRVLDMFCYAGGFALTAALGGAREVLGVDSSQKAVVQAQANAERNGLANVRFQSGDAFEVLQGLARANQRFGGVVLDPPRFAGSRAAADKALRAYHRLNRLGMDLVEPEGILVTCSCSGHVSRDDFFMMLQSVAQQARRSLQVLEARGAAPDHPVSVTCPETEYLKCFVCRVGA